jgi:hypothetical protein
LFSVEGQRKGFPNLSEGRPPITIYHVSKGFPFGAQNSTAEPSWRMKQVKAWQKGSKAVFVRVSEADNSTRAMIDAFLAKNPQEGFCCGYRSSNGP